MLPDTSCSITTAAAQWLQATAGICVLQSQLSRFQLWGSWCRFQLFLDRTTALEWYHWGNLSMTRAATLAGIRGCSDTCLGFIAGAHCSTYGWSWRVSLPPSASQGSLYITGQPQHHRAAPAYTAQPQHHRPAPASQGSPSKHKAASASPGQPQHHRVAPANTGQPQHHRAASASQGSPSLTRADPASQGSPSKTRAAMFAGVLKSVEST